MIVNEPTVQPLLVDVSTACVLLSVKKTKLFGLLRERKLERVKLGGKSLVTTRSIQALATAAVLPMAQPSLEEPDEIVPLPLLGVMKQGDH